ncbi:5-formyltetrahydrofolate cyclo-ligase [Streptomyces sp. NPDC059070]|uniref:5-formyltetrahydrofolate cyclo-ligase n=1 Tax=Streptomyces sp. NPDC059070 TaxID=3346713 RepID=UPI0036B49BD2
MHDEEKQLVRTAVWEALDAAGAVRDETAHGRIPNFFGAEAAARRLADLDIWKAAKVVKSVPDKAQLPVRSQALREGKIVYMAVPKLATRRPFYLLDPQKLSVPHDFAASSKHAADVAPTVDVDQLRPIDVVVLGSVAVNRAGVRIGKGAGYSDLEFALLSEAGLIRRETLVVTTVHSLQVVDGAIPATEHDVNVDLIVTPDEVIQCTTPHRPPGIFWEHLDERKISSIPALLAQSQSRTVEDRHS